MRYHDFIFDRKENELSDALPPSHPSSLPYGAAGRLRLNFHARRASERRFLKALSINLKSSVVRFVWLNGRLANRR